MAKPTIKPVTGCLYGEWQSGYQLGDPIIWQDTNLGRRWDIHGTWASFSSNLTRLLGHLTPGAIPYLTVPYGDVRSSAAQTFYAALRTYDQPVLMRYDSEFDRFGRDLQTWLNDWRYLYGQLPQNVLLAWVPTGYGLTAGAKYRAVQYYPGAQYVDWTGFDAYDWPGKKPRTFDACLTAPYAKLLSLAPDKPVLLGEFGVRKDLGDQYRHDWLAGAQSIIKSKYTQLGAISYFNVAPVKEPGIDWLLDTPLALEGWKELGQDTYFNARSI